MPIPVIALAAAAALAAAEEFQLPLKLLGKPLVPTGRPVIALQVKTFQAALPAPKAGAADLAEAQALCKGASWLGIPSSACLKGIGGAEKASTYIQSTEVGSKALGGVATAVDTARGALDTVKGWIF